MKGAREYEEVSGVGLSDDVQPFPVDVFPTAVQEFITTAAEALPCPVDFLGATILPTAGAAVGTTRLLEIKPGHQQGTALFLAFVGSPGSKKSPALDLVTKPCFEQQFTEHRVYLDQAERARERDEREPEHPKQYTLTDATMEAIAEALDHNPRGVLYALDEMAAWVKSMDQYKSGGKGSDLQSWLKIYSSGSIVVKRKRQAPLVVKRPHVSVVGGIQPDVLGELSSGRRDGFLDRILFSYPQREAFRRSEVALPDAVVSGYTAVMKSLYALELHDTSGQPLVLEPTAEARAFYDSWLDCHFAEMNAADFPDHLEGPWAKLEGVFLRLALTLEMLYQASGESKGDEVTCRAFQGAKALTGYFQAHTRRVYTHLMSNEGDRQQQSAKDWLRRRTVKEVTVRDVVRAGVAGVKNSEEARALLSKLSDAGEGELVQVKQLSGQLSEVYRWS